jgi:hypothetical protein
LENIFKHVLKVGLFKKIKNKLKKKKKKRKKLYAIDISGLGTKTTTKPQSQNFVVNFECSIG